MVTSVERQEAYNRVASFLESTPIVDLSDWRRQDATEYGPAPEVVVREGVPHYRIHGYHFTHGDAGYRIQKEGFKPGEGGWYGTGVYIARSDAPLTVELYREWAENEGRRLYWSYWEFEVGGYVPVADTDLWTSVGYQRGAHALAIPASYYPMEAHSHGQWRLKDGRYLQVLRAERKQ